MKATNKSTSLSGRASPRATEPKSAKDKERYVPAYYQDDVPIFDHDRIKGHAVRAAYLMSGVTDVAAETGDERLFKMLDRVWRNTTERNMYLTGGIGQRQQLLELGVLLDHRR